MSTRVTKGSINIKARRKRLLVLADWLESAVLPSLNGAKFDLADWGTYNDNKSAPTDIREAKSCGFQGCAVGWALTCPQLRKAGIHKLFNTDQGGALRVGPKGFKAIY